MMFALVSQTCTVCVHVTECLHMYMYACKCLPVCESIRTCVCTCVSVQHAHVSPLLDVVCAPHQAALGLLLSLLRNHPFCVSNQSCASRSPAKPLILGLLKSCFN